MSDEIIIAIASLVVSVVVGALNYRGARRANQRVSQMKSLDLRVELRKLLNEVSLDILQLPIDMSSYCNSWKMHWANKNMGNQSIADVAGIEAGRDGAELTMLRNALPEKGHLQHSETELEALIDKVHWVKIRVERLKEKYAKKILDLDQDRKKHQEELLANRKVRQQDLLARFGDVNSAESLMRRNDILEGRF